MFANLNLCLDTPAALRAWLSTQPRPAWGVTSSCYHNTYIPDESQWRGHASMISMARHYADQGWSSGPHVFIAVGTAYDGLWLMTPPTQPGTHAGPCNASRFGLEVVGNFAVRAMSHAQLVALSETAAALHDWAGIGSDIVAHRDCMPGRSCPGNAAYAQKSDIQALVAFAQETPPATYTEDSPLLGTTDVSALAVAERLVKAKQLYTPREIRMFAVEYYRLCTSVGLNPLLAIAQMTHETGWLTSWWCDRPRRNPAGLGVTGVTRPYSDPRPMPPDAWQADPPANVWRRGYAFADWQRESIPAHVGRLCAYATQPAARTPAQSALIAFATSRHPLPEPVHGSAQTLKQLGKAHNKSGLGWASPGTYYGASIAKIGNTLGGT